MPVFCQALEKWGQMSHTTEKYGDIGNFFGVTYVILPFVNLKLVGTWAPTAKIIGDIPDFNVLNVPKTQPRHNPECYTTSRCITDHQTDSLEFNAFSEFEPVWNDPCISVSLFIYPLVPWPTITRWPYWNPGSPSSQPRCLMPAGSHPSDQRHQVTTQFHPSKMWGGRLAGVWCQTFSEAGGTLSTATRSPDVQPPCLQAYSVK